MQPILEHTVYHKFVLLSLVCKLIILVYEIGRLVEVLEILEYKLDKFFCGLNKWGVDIVGHSESFYIWAN